MNTGYRMYEPGYCPLAVDAEKVVIDPTAFTIVLNDSYLVSSLLHPFASVIYLTFLNLTKVEEKRGQDYLHGVIQGLSYMALNGGKINETPSISGSEV